ncbi:MAG: glycosyltransferase family 2 protein [Bacteroidota bacterium]
MQKQTLISIITVVFNGENHIENALKSVANQTDKNFEYIIVDGDSTDNTLEIIKKYSEHIDILVSEPDQGIYDAMNKGVLKASGEYIYILNSDDKLYDSSVINHTIKFMEKNPKDIILGFVDVVFKSPDYIKEEKIKFCRNNLKRGIQPPHSGSFFKRKCIIDLELFNTNYKSAADFDLFCKAFVSNCSYAYFDRKIAVFNDGGISSQENIGRMEGAKIIKKYFGIFWFLKFRIIETLKIPFKKIAKLFGVYSYLLRVYKQRL